MRASHYFMPTLREAPAEAELPSHRLLLRGGFIRKLAAGVYTYLPLGWRVIRKIEQIVREESDRIGGIELFMPALVPQELLDETGRSGLDILFRLKDRHQRPFTLGFTHEEVITDIIRHAVSSYRQMPLLLYQIQTKFRDEPRPRGGVIRAREFIMYDGYSFDADAGALETMYQKLREAYIRMFQRMGLPTLIVDAEAGAIGGGSNEEFMIIAESGEDKVLRERLREKILLPVDHPRKVRPRDEQQCRRDERDDFGTWTRRQERARDAIDRARAQREKTCCDRMEQVQRLERQPARQHRSNERAAGGIPTHEFAFGVREQNLLVHSHRIGRMGGRQEGEPRGVNKVRPHTQRDDDKARALQPIEFDGDETSRQRERDHHLDDDTAKHKRRVGAIIGNEIVQIAVEEGEEEQEKEKGEECLRSGKASSFFKVHACRVLPSIGVPTSRRACCELHRRVRGMA